MNRLYKLRLLLLYGCMLAAPALRGQQVSLLIRTTDTLGRPVPSATVSLSAAGDGKQTHAAVSDTAGAAVFSLEAPADYHAVVSAIGYETLTWPFRVYDTSTVLALRLKQSGEQLDEIVIRDKKSLMRQDGDKTVIDPESLVAASTNGYEVLEKTPGIFIDQDGNIYLSSTTPATIYINGREMKMSRTDIATMLKNLPPNAIDRLEILRTPSARYDASGSGGVVNVVLKKGVRIGFNGSFNTGLQQGKYGNQYAGLSLSHNDGSLSAYLNLNYMHKNSYELIRTERRVFADTILKQEAYTTYPGNAWYLGYGAGKELGKTWNVNYDGRVSYSNSFNKTDNENSFSRATGELLLGAGGGSTLHNEANAFMLSQDLALEHKLDTAGSEWVNSFSYMYSTAGAVQDFAAGPPLAYTGGGDADSRRHFISGQSDLTRKLPRHISLEAGLKATFLDFTNQTAYGLTYNGVTVPDNSRSSHYRYREQINSAYLQASKGFGDIILKAGLRLENTNMDGHQLSPTDTSLKVNRTDLFPYAYLSKKVMSIGGFELRAYLVYRKTIARPSYEQLNPFPRYLDQFLSEAGNPSLKPQFTHTYEANVSVDERPLLAVGINDSRNLFTNVYYQADSNRVQALRTYENIGKNREIYFRGLGAIPPGGVYFFVLGGQYNYNIYEGLYEGQPLSFRKGGFLFFTYHQLRLGKKTQVTMNGFLRLKGPLQFYELSRFGALNLNVNRRFLKDKLTVTLSISDLFYSNNNKFTIRQGTVDAQGYRESDSRRFGINLRYNFGFHKKDEEKDIFLQQPDKVN